ncbi:MAG TPA: S8 family serine peptidase [Streptosporangiaceae bacterium]|jgi:hypothetical protein|nr:S8 family serine peptidase [Streptosporangiaceae bacterium]
MIVAVASRPAVAAVAPAAASFGQHPAQALAPATPRSVGTTALGSWRPAAAPRPGTTGTAASGAGQQVLVVLGGQTTVTGSPLGGPRHLAVRAPMTSNAAVNTALSKIGAKSVRPLMPQLSGAQAEQLHSAAKARLGSGAVDLSRVEVVDLSRPDSASAARTLAATPGIAYAEADQTVSPMNTGAVPLPGWASSTGTASAPARGATPASSPAPVGGATSASGVPDNYGLSSSLQSFLNAGGVNAVGAYSLLAQRFQQLPGTGETITNVSIGDLTDAGMAAAGDRYVQQYGPTTIIQNGQRYLDIPSMPLIPTYTAGADGVLDPTGSAEYEDPQLGEILLDFSVMAPLPHDQQRPGMQGSGATDLLGIAPGASYRLVVPASPTLDQVAVALLAAAQQTPRPNVITASLGVGTDVAGFPGRYLEDDPIEQAVIAAIVQQYGITVVVSSNDGTRLYTNAAVGPDGGSTPTNVTRHAGSATNINDDAYSTTPSVVPDSGAIAAGGTTTDDTLAVPPQDGGSGSANGTWATTRTDGSGVFSSGFGTRVDVSAPSDAIPAFVHKGQTAESVQPVLNGGTSASAPEIAAAAAVVLQASRLTGQPATPGEVRALLERTGRPVATPPQADQRLHVGPQVNVTAALEAVLGQAHGTPAAPQIVRLSVAHRQTIGGLGGVYTEVTDPGLIDLAGPGTGRAATGEGLVGPVTIGADVTGLPAHGGVSYALRIGSHAFGSATPSIRLTPAQILTAAALPVTATANRQVSLTFEVLDGQRVLASATRQLTFGPTDGSYVEALPPVVQPVVTAGQPVQVSYDLTGVRNVSSPKLVVSGVGHWNPVLAPIFTAAYSVPLTGTTGTVTVPASAFDGGGGIYGIGIAANSALPRPVYGEFASVRVEGGTAAQRPAAPTLAAPATGSFGHQAEATRAAPGFAVRYDVSGIPGATGARLEFSAPGPNLYRSLNTVNNQNGSAPDHDGVDSSATLSRELTGTRGTVTFDALSLGLATSLDYNVRVFATDPQGAVIGQASPTSLLAVDDGPAPGGATVSSFAIEPGGTSVAATDDSVGGASVYDYDTATGTYGLKLTSDPAGGAHYDVFGVDPGIHHVLVLHMTASGGALLETYDTITGSEVGSPVDIGSRYYIGGGRVDPALHLAAVLVHRRSDNADFVLPLDLTTGALGTPIPLDSPGVPVGQYDLLDVDATTGTVYVQRVSNFGICFAGPGSGQLAAVNLRTGTVTTTSSGELCAQGLVADQNGNLDEFWYHSFSINFPGTTDLMSIPTATLTAAPAIAVDNTQQGVTLAVDGVHQLALVAFNYPPLTPVFGGAGTFSNNDATSRLAVVDLKTGATVGTVTGVETRSGYFGGDLDAAIERSIQLDPATRTGWIYSSDGTQIQQFSY